MPCKPMVCSALKAEGYENDFISATFNIASLTHKCNHKMGKIEGISNYNNINSDVLCNMTTYFLCNRFHTLRYIPACSILYGKPTAEKSAFSVFHRENNPPGGLRMEKTCVIMTEMIFDI